MNALVRPATRQDVPEIARVLTDAFGDYPWTRWTVAADDHDRRLWALHTMLLTELAVPYGRVDVAEATDGTVTAAAVWMPGDAGVPDVVEAEVGRAVAELSGDRAAMAAAAEAVLAPHRPADPHITLATVGVRRDRQNHGLGTATLAPGLRAADRDGLGAYLETSAPANRRFYQRLGFAVTAVVDLPHGGPRTWSMFRSPHRRAGQEPGEP